MISTAMSAEQPLYEIFEYSYPPLWQHPAFIFFTLVFVCCIFGAGYFLFKRYKDRLLTPEEWALLQLTELSKQSCSTLLSLL